MQNPQIISEKAKEIVLDLLPAKSRQIYEKEYEVFIQWKKSNKIVIIDEDVILNHLYKKVSAAIFYVQFNIIMTFLVFCYYSLKK